MKTPVRWIARIKDANGCYRFETDICPMSLEHAQVVVFKYAEEAEERDYPSSWFPMVIEASLETVK